MKNSVAEPLHNSVAEPVEATITLSILHFDKLSERRKNSVNEANQYCLLSIFQLLTF